MSDILPVIRPGRLSDIPRAFDLIRELAVFERAPDQVLITPEILARDGFGKNPLFSLTVAEVEGEVIGIAICYVRYSTWKGAVLYLEDLIVSANYRGRGIGNLLFTEVVRKAQEGNYYGLIWQVLDWNADAIRFYERFGARFSSEWMTGMLGRDEMQRILTA